ncbi:tetratricopeptide repeat protein [Vannielia litorea]|uniref:tetratricopeptide repeat protein n=1 Tax=Vannielia litorea TaxID=1217970 RepID=UPI001BCDE527|nr:tetratricopeptide repeat protein [Vannielia litorea]
MLRSAAVSLSLLFALPLAAQSAEEVEAARALFRDGQFGAALEVLDPAAKAGDAAAQNALGNAYHYGRGRPVDAAAAIAWYERSVAQGNPLAMLNLAQLFRWGMEGQGPDHPRALALFRQATEAGLAYAHGPLGQMHELGLGTPVDYARAAAHYAAAEGNTEALVDLGSLYLRGDGVAQDGARARALFEEAAAANHPRGLTALAQMLDFGLLETPPDHARALALYQQAQAQGYAYAGQLLSQFLSTDARPGPWHDPVRGHAFCLWALAVANSDEHPRIAPTCEAQSAALTAPQRAEAAEIAKTL